MALIDEASTEMLAWQPPRGGAEGDWWFWLNFMPTLRVLGLDCTHLSEAHAVYRMNHEDVERDCAAEVASAVVAAAAEETMMVMAMRVNGPWPMPRNAALQIDCAGSALAPLTFRARPTGRRGDLTFIEVEVENRHGHRCAFGSMSTSSSHTAAEITPGLAEGRTPCP